MSEGVSCLPLRARYLVYCVAVWKALNGNCLMGIVMKKYYIHGKEDIIEVH